MPRLAGTRPKLRPSTIFPAITRQRPANEITAVAASGRKATASEALTSGGPATEIVVTSAAAAVRSTAVARRRITVSTTTSASLTSSSSPVRCPVCTNSRSMLIDRNRNSTPTSTRESRSETSSRLMGRTSVDLQPAANLALFRRRGDGSRGNGFLPRRLFVDEIRAARCIEQVARDDRLLTAVPAERRHLVHRSRGWHERIGRP